jgi:DNA-binding XRE family transcriptional regulator
MKAGSRYSPLYDRLSQSGQRELTLTFTEIEALIGAALPHSARTSKAWWSNRAKGAVQANAWRSAKYHVKEVDLAAGRVIFYRPGVVYTVHRDGEAVQWDGTLVRALRLHMGLTQGQLAAELGVRQQTISEWENGAYAPTRASSNLLSRVAREAGFAYNIELLG